MRTANPISLKATVISARTVQGAGESVRENEENLVPEALMIRSGLVGEVLVIQGPIAAKEGGDLVRGAGADLSQGVKVLDQGKSLGTAEVGAIEAIQGANQDQKNGPDQDDQGEPEGIRTHTSPSKNEITPC